ncbi:MAG TPA: polysaccharide deacetylase family protein, partial [Tepidisphaeraceae bacterium]|nr:polysaccharide deacetylase family protein [Tepidisphaeraceae bacterium]
MPDLDLNPLFLSLLRPLMPWCAWAGDPTVPAVALSFDDGPHPAHTPPLLDVLAGHNVRATFFCLGDRLDAATGVVRRAAADGHELAVHGDVHRSFFFRRTADVVAAVSRTRDRIAVVAGISPAAIRLLRPPFGHVGPGQARALRAAGFAVVQASVVPGDWSAPSPRVVRRVLRHARNGSLVAMHDGDNGGADVA